MNKYNRFDDNKDEGLSLMAKVGLVFFVAVYPLFVSIYTMLPPLIGLAGYIVIINLEKEKTYVLAPLLLSVFTIMIVYIFIYTPLKRLVRCKVCLLFALIVIIDFIYYLSLFIYDFMFNTTSVLADMLLVYYIVVDILLGLLL